MCNNVTVNTVQKLEASLFALYIHFKLHIYNREEEAAGEYGMGDE